MAHAPRYGDRRSPPMKAFLSMQVDWKRIGQSTARRSAVDVGLELSVCHRSQDISSSNWRKFFKADGCSRGNTSALNGVLVRFSGHSINNCTRVHGQHELTNTSVRVLVFCY